MSESKSSTVAEKLKLCRGCTDDFYNHRGAAAGPCWSLKSARKVRRWKLGWWTSPTQPAAFEEVRTLSCHHEPGKYAFAEKLPPHAIDPIRLPKAVRQ